MQEKLKKLNIALIKKYPVDSDEYKKQLLLKELLNDTKCFFKITPEMAYAILRELELEEAIIPRIYLELIDSKNFN